MSNKSIHDTMIYNNCLIDFACGKWVRLGRILTHTNDIPYYNLFYENN